MFLPPGVPGQFSETLSILTNRGQYSLKEQKQRFVRLLLPLDASWRRCRSANQSSGSLPVSLGSFLGNTTCAATPTPARDPGT